jgi:hypothetical protein
MDAFASFSEFKGVVVKDKRIGCGGIELQLLDTGTSQSIFNVLDCSKGALNTAK